MKKMLFVMNPFAGMRKANRYLPEIISIFNRGGYDVTVHITEGRGDATEAVARLAKEVDLVVCCGGDGTFNETVSGLLASGADVPVGYIPAGSTNDFANSLHLSENILEAAREIVDGQPESYDLGSFGGRYFSYVASFGAFTRASYATPQNVKNALGHAAYLLEGISEISQIRKTHVRIELDDGRVVEDDFIFGAICNSTSVGGIFTLDPKQVDMRDGKFEILLLRTPKDLGEISECVQAVRKQQYNCRMLTFCSTASLKIYTSPDMPWTLDGEREDGHSEIEVKNLHRIFRLMKRQERE